MATPCRTGTPPRLKSVDGALRGDFGKKRPQSRRDSTNPSCDLCSLTNGVGHNLGYHQNASS